MHILSRDELQEAIDNESFFFLYQPKISFLTGCVVSAEALIRCHGKGGVILGPASFIPVAEASGQIRHITRIAIENAVPCLQKLAREENPLTLAVNITYQDLLDGSLCMSWTVWIVSIPSRDVCWFF